MRTVKVLVISLVLMVAAVACGQTDPPTTEDIQDNAEYFTLTIPDGRVLECVQYGSMSSATQDSKSWFAFDCDWPDPVDQ